MGFNWQDEREHSPKKWLVPVLITPLTKGRDNKKFREIEEATAGFTNVEITMQINGIEVSVDHFLARLEDNIEHAAREEARAQLDSVEGFPALKVKLAEIELAVTRHLEEMVAQAEIPIAEPPPEW